MSGPTEQQIIEALARFIGYQIGYLDVGGDLNIQVIRSGERELTADFDPLASLDSMAIIEAELEKRGLYEHYYHERFKIFASSHDTPNRQSWQVDRQGPAIRARAAYEILRSQP